MASFPKIAWISILAATFLASLLPTTANAQNAQVRHVAVLSSGGAIEIEIETSQRVVPMTQVVTDPDRLVIDFPDARPGPLLRSLSVNKGEVKGVRAGLFSANPPITRVVVELNSAQDFQLVPSSKSVIVKIAGAVSTAATVSPATVSAVPAMTKAETPSVRTPEPVPVAKVQESTPVRSLVTRASVSLPVPTAADTNPQVRHVSVLKSGGATEIEIEASERIVPAVQVVTGPDRLVIDFPKASPGPQLRALTVNQGEVKGVRVGLLNAKPPVTRVVLDLKSPQAYQLFPLGKSVIVKLGGTVGIATAPSPNLPESAPALPTQPAKRFEISFQDGLLSVMSTKGSLADVLSEIRTQTGADIAIPAGAEQEEVAASIGPGSPRDVVAQLLNGSRYNFIIVGADNDANKLERVILSPKGAGEIVVQDLPSTPEPVPVAQMQPPERSVAEAPAPPPSPPPQEEPQGDSMPPDTTQPGDPQPAPN